MQYLINVLWKAASQKPITCLLADFEEKKKKSFPRQVIQVKGK